MHLHKLTSAALLIVTISAAHADDSPVTAELQVSTLNKYVWRGINLVNGYVVQPSLTFSYQNWNLNFWGNYETTGINTYVGTATGKNRVTEWDTTLSYTHESKSGILDFGISHYDYPHTGFPSTTEVFAAIEGNSQSFAGNSWILTPNFSFNMDIDEADGYYASLGATAEHNLKNSDSISISTWFGYSDKKHNNYNYGNNKAALADFGLTTTYTRTFSDSTYGFASLSFTSLLDKGHLAGAPNRTNTILGFGFGMTF